MADHLYLRFDVEVRLPISENPGFENAWINMTETQRAKKAQEMAHGIAFGQHSWRGRPLGELLRPTSNSRDIDLRHTPTVTAMQWALR